jgi:mannose-6-phosphate isomerase-like protein (cupin superfamily)
MNHKHLRFGRGFRVILNDKHSQAAQMTLAPGEKEGGPDNRHQGADQWLFVVRGSGRAMVGGRSIDLRTGTLILIRRGVVHEINNTGRSDLHTLNVYVPPAYTPGNDELPAGRSRRSPRGGN